MHAETLDHFRHEHHAPDTAARNERRTRWVVLITFAMMIGELIVGTMTNSLALTADGWHMATHAGALGMSALAYWFARSRGRSTTFTFGTGKVYALAGYTSAIVLALVAILMVAESGRRLLAPMPIQFAEALPVAVLGLLVNLVSVTLLHPGEDGHDHGGGHGHDHAFAPPHEEPGHAGHAHDDHDHAAHAHDAAHARPAHAHDHAAHAHDAHDHAARTHDDHHHAAHARDDHGHHHAPARRSAARAAHAPGGHVDHNARAAYLHVLADAFTSVLAIGALVGGRYLGWAFLDPMMGIVGGVVILRWGYGLSKGAARQLLDVVPSAELADRIRARLEDLDDVRVADLHLWEVGPGRRSCIVSLVTHTPRTPEAYRTVIRQVAPIEHVTVEVHSCSGEEPVPA